MDRPSLISFIHMELQSASIAWSQGFLDSFCGSSPGRWTIFQLLCSQARRKLHEELTQKHSSKPCDRAIDALCSWLVAICDIRLSPLSRLPYGKITLTLDIEWQQCNGRSQYVQGRSRNFRIDGSLDLLRRGYRESECRHDFRQTSLFCVACSTSSSPQAQPTLAFCGRRNREPSSNFQTSFKLTTVWRKIPRGVAESRICSPRVSCICLAIPRWTTIVVRSRSFKS